MSSQTSASRGSWIAALCFALGAGLALGVYAHSYFVSEFPDLAYWEWLAPGLIAVTATGLAFWTLYSFVPARLADRSAGIRRLWFVLAWLCGLLTVAVIPIHTPTWPFTPQHELRIVATGERNQAANGAEVWLISLKYPDGRSITAEHFTADEGWENRAGRYVSYKHPPATLSWSGRLNEPLTLELNSHPWSGIVELTWKEQTWRVDLYAEKDTTHIERLEPVPIAPATIRAWQVFAALTNASLFGVLFLISSVWLATGKPRPVSTPPRWAWLAYALPCAATWTLGLFIFWPGLLTPDSINQWMQLHTLGLSDGHPAFHTLFNGLIVKAWSSPAAIALTQVIAGSLVCGWGIAVLRRAGLPRWLALVTCLLLALSPVNVKLMITLWKDIPFSIACLAWFVLLFRVIHTNGRSLSGWTPWLIFGITAALTTLFRHNGAPAVLIGFAIALLVNVRYWKQLTLAGLLMLGIFFGVRGPLYRALEVDRVEPVSYYVHKASRAISENTFQLLAAHVVGNTALEPEEQELLELVCDLNHWEAIYSPCCMTWEATSKYLRQHKKTSWKEIDSHGPALRALLRELNERNPTVLLNHYYWRTNYVWRVQFTRYREYSTALALPQPDGSVLTIFENRAGLKPAPTWPGFDYKVARWMEWLTADWRYYLTWRPAAHLWIMLGGVLVAAAAKRNWKYTLLFLPLAAHSFFVAFLAPCHCFRYQYPIYLAASLLGPYLLWSGRCISRDGDTPPGSKPIITDDAPPEAAS